MFFIKDFFIKDYDENFNKLLKQLTESNFNKTKFLNVYKNLSHQKKIFIVKNNDNDTIATGSILLEQKFTHNFSKVAHIEDIVVLESYRGRGIGKLLINFLVKFAEKNNCYKVILNCDEKNINFYKKLGFSKKNVEMSYYFKKQI